MDTPPCDVAFARVLESFTQLGSTFSRTGAALAVSTPTVLRTASWPVDVIFLGPGGVLRRGVALGVRLRLSLRLRGQLVGDVSGTKA